jgi:hypothetical protein
MSFLHVLPLPGTLFRSVLRHKAAALIRHDYDKYGKLVRDIGIEPQ